MDSVLKNELMKGLESANQLQVLFTESKTKPQQNKESLMAIILNTFETAISILKGSRSENGVCNLTNPDTNFKHLNSDGNRRSSRNQAVKVIRNSLTPEDGYHWRKCGHKAINKEKYPREYYKCGNYGQGCPARKYIQMVSEVPTEYRMVYYGHHTCNIISTINDYASQLHPILVDFNDNQCSDHMLWSRSLNVPKIDQNQMKRGNEVINEETTPLPHVPNAPSYSSNDHYSPSNSLDEWVQDQLKEDGMELLSEHCDSMNIPILTDEELQHLMSLDADLDEVMDLGI